MHFLFITSRLYETYLFSAFLTTRFRIMRQELLCNCCAKGNFFMDCIARSPAPASIAQVALSEDLKQSTEIIYIT